ncbi:hypothetical protein D1BOALGB6SA_8493 [Olavius sp. associated proteobacterium Delta 1]|nr:hypothetical protein D1BOALGB6SA_8493 [Olavius sp. associated proteobacterium Delta 1]
MRQDLALCTFFLLPFIAAAGGRAKFFDLCGQLTQHIDDIKLFSPWRRETRRDVFSENNYNFAFLAPLG